MKESRNIYWRSKYNVRRKGIWWIFVIIFRLPPFEESSFYSKTLLIARGCHFCSSVWFSNVVEFNGKFEFWTNFLNFNFKKFEFPKTVKNKYTKLHAIGNWSLYDPIHFMKKYKIYLKPSIIRLYWGLCLGCINRLILFASSIISKHSNKIKGKNPL